MSRRLDLELVSLIVDVNHVSTEEIVTEHTVELRKADDTRERCEIEADNGKIGNSEIVDRKRLKRAMKDRIAYSLATV